MLPPDIQLLSLQEIGCTVDLPETRDTLEGNAEQKAQYVHKNFGINCFADDTGLEVDALNGAPGVYSARYAGPQKDDQANCTKLLRELKGAENRAARFRTVICLVRKQAVDYFEGAINGTIVSHGKGSNGFGYDPIFLPESAHQTFAEMTSSQKNLLSHRAIAIKKLVEFLNTTL